jgi:hypothetical protein
MDLSNITNFKQSQVSVYNVKEKSVKRFVIPNLDGYRVAYVTLIFLYYLLFNV